MAKSCILHLHLNLVCQRRAGGVLYSFTDGHFALSLQDRYLDINFETARRVLFKCDPRNIVPVARQLNPFIFKWPLEISAAATAASFSTAIVFTNLKNARNSLRMRTGEQLRASSSSILLILNCGCCCHDDNYIITDAVVRTQVRSKCARFATREGAVSRYLYLR